MVVVGADIDRLANGEGLRQIGGATDLWRLLRDSDAFDELHLNKRFLRQGGRPDLSPYTTVLNLITDPDQNHQVLEILGKLLRGFRGRVINPPEAIMRTGRDRIATRLTGIDGLRVPRTIRLRGGKPAVVANTVERAGAQFPVILRLAGTHMGNIVGLIGSLDELQAALIPGSDHIITEFVDFQSADGFYRKYRIYFFGQRTILRHQLISDGWNIHVRDRARCMAQQPRLCKEEARLLLRPEGDFAPAIHAVFEAVRERLALDFVGMDFGIDRGGDVVLFEANATMNYFPIFTDPKFAYLQMCVPPAQQAFREMVGLVPAAGAVA
ncbi:MAG: hypothetical protein LH465_01585 [Sphingomonas bacterium]|nr:hypothetical protein [Sphingomonas bacterium]